MSERKQIISLGGGVQSVTMVLMNLHGEIKPAAECAIFADTGWERKATYATMEWLRKVASQHDFPIYTVGAGNIRTDMLDESKDRYEHMPLFTESEKGKGQLRRQCTRHYKIDPVRREIRKRFGFQQFDLWIGFSTDEIVRMKPSRVKYIRHRFPLVEKRMGRDNCVAWLARHGYQIPEKSACVGCPYHSNAEWAKLKETAPDEFEDACQFDDQIRNKHLNKARRKDLPLYLHESLEPLRDVSFNNPDQLALFGDQICGGGCFL